ncbi:MAG: efflux RND transporter periplasmic adaptor subunit [Actinomycetes bacterium]
MAEQVPAHRRRRWKVVAAVVVALGAVVGTTAWAMTRSSDAAAATGVVYRTVTVSTGNVRETVSASGTIAPAATEDLSFDASGEVTGVYVTEGQKVAKGQRLATLSSASLRSQVAQAQASLASAKARLASDESASASSAQIASDEAAVDVARAQLADATTALAGATLTSPLSGTVTAVNVTVGQQIGSSRSSGSSGTGSSGTGSSGTGSSGTGSSGTGSSAGSGSSSADVQVISTGSYVVDATVDASDVAKIAKGDQVTITPTGATTPVFGLVASVGIVASSSSGSATFPVVVTVTGSPTGLYAGSTATVAITYKQVSNVLVVPTLAVTRSGGKAYVTVERGGARTQQEVSTGLSASGSTQVLSGLSDGDTVVVAVRTGTGGARTGGGTGRTGGFGGGGPPDGFGGGAPPNVVVGGGSAPNPGTG